MKPCQLDWQKLVFPEIFDSVQEKLSSLMNIKQNEKSTFIYLTTGMFIDEMTDLLTNKIPKCSNLIILGDFNISAENVSNPDTVIFNDTMGALGLQQHVQGPTHKMSNTLDLIFTQLEMWLMVTGTATHHFMSDHCMVSIELSLKSQYCQQ